MGQGHHHVAGGSAPDVAFISEPLRQYATNDSLLALDSLIKSDPDVDVNDFYKVGLEFFQYNGKQYGLPKDLNTSSPLQRGPVQRGRAEDADGATMRKATGPGIPTPNWPRR